MKLNFYWSGPIANSAFMFVCDQTVMEGTLLVQQETLSAVFLLPFKGSYWNSTPSAQLPWATQLVRLNAITL
jgi:hypothetical protein